MSTFRVLLVCGSFQQRSANRAALEAAQSYIGQTDSASVEHADGIVDIPVLNADVDGASVASVAQFCGQLQRCDGALISGPEYAGGISGGLKNVLDWMVGMGGLYRKPVAIISAGTSGGFHARKQMVQTLTWQGAHVVSQLGITTPNAKMDSAGRIVDAATIAQIQEVTQALLDVATMSSDERLRCVRELTKDFGVEDGHVAPLD